jgi:uncharacterized protein (TIGR02594 family)
MAGEDLRPMTAAVLSALEASTAALAKFANTAKEAAHSGGFKQMDNALIGIAKNLAGPVGIAAGFYAAGKALAEFSDQRLVLSEFAKDVHLSADSVYGLRRAMFLAGKEGAEADRAIASFSSTMQDLNAKRFAAPVFQDLMQKGPDMQKVVKDLMAFGDDVDGALRYVESHWKDWGVRFRHEFLEAFHMSESDMQATFGRLSGQLDEHIQKMAEDNAKRWRGYRQMFSDAGEYAFGGLLDLMDKLGPTALEARGQQIKSLLTPKAVDPSARYSVGEDPMGADYQRPESLVGKVHGWLGKRSDAGTSGSTDFSGMRRTDDLIQVESDSNKTLRDIRDSLQRMETGTGRTAGTAGTAGAGTSYGVGAHGGGLQAPLGGFRGGGGGSRGDRNNNPGNLKMGPHAKAFGATHADAGGFAVFPDAISGAAAHEALLKSDTYKGLTLDQFTNKYAEGSPSWSKTVGGELGIKGGDIVDNQDPRLSGAIRKAEGTVAAAGGIPSNILAEARRVVAAGGGAEGAKSYIQSKGYDVDSAWCGDFAAAVVKGAGGTPPKNYQVASNWRNFGQPVEGDPQPGDIAVRRGAATGSTGSHVTMVDQFDPETGRFKGIGGNQGRMTSSFPRSRYDFRRGRGDARGTDSDTQFGGSDEYVHARDMGKSGGGGGDASMSASIDFKNMPSWVRTSIDDTVSSRT